MGRGRAKAKQTKVARELKYGGPETDFDRLQAELSTQSTTAPKVEPVDDEYEDTDDPYAKYIDDDEDKRRQA